MELHEIIGEGQFGDVHKGVYHVPSHQISQSNLNNPDAAKGHLPIAVKTCKVEGRESMAEKFLEEACKFRTNDYIPQRKYLIYPKNKTVFGDIEIKKWISFYRYNAAI